MNHNKYFILFANCIPVKGANRSIICDLQQGKYVFIPNSLSELMSYSRTQRIEDLLIRFDELDENMLAEYLDYLEGYGLGFYTDNPNEFPELNLSSQSQCLINDCIIELSEDNLTFTDKIINELQITGCQSLELRSYLHFDIDLIFRFIDRLKHTRVRSVEIYSCFADSINIQSLDSYVAANQIVSNFFVHSAPFNRVQELNDRLIFSTQKIDSGNCCGNISTSYFSVNLPFVLEAQKYNSCLYRKISIDTEGNLKNCPSLPTTFGNIRTNGFVDAIDQLAFTSLWNINKDQIDTCKDCEFRYICSDCRAFVSNTTAKPLKCNYNPYTSKYENE